MKNKIFKFSFKNIIFAGIFALIILILSISSIGWKPFEGLDNNINDALYQHKGSTDKRITIVGIDEPTIEKYNAYNAVEYREHFANILNAWADKGYTPSAIGFDIIFNKQYGCDEVDIKLRDAMKKQNVILGVNGMSRTEAPYGLSETIYDGAKGIGYVDAITDNDEAIRRTYLKSDNYDSLAYSL